MTGTKIVRVNGVLMRVPDDEMADPATPGPFDCDAAEPDWPGALGGAVCTLRRHPAGPSGIAHIAHDGESIVAIWGAPVVVNDSDT